MNIITTHPKLVTFAIGLTIMFVVGIAIGMVDHQAFASTNTYTGNNGAVTV